MRCDRFGKLLRGISYTVYAKLSCRAAAQPLHESFDKILAGKSSRVFTDVEIAKLWQTLVHKVVTLNLTGFVHRDLKAVNIVVTTDEIEGGQVVHDVLLIDLEGAIKVGTPILAGG